MKREHEFSYVNKVWKWFWIANFIIQFLLFRSYCLRNIVNYIPENMDQVGYIGVTYQIYDFFLEGQFWEGIQFAFQNGVNSGMMLIGVLNLFLFGFSRFSLLIPNFLALFFCEIIGTKVVQRITGHKGVGLLYYGVLLLTQAIFAAVGGVFDYRWDFLSFCVYSIWILLTVQYLYTNEQKAFYCSAVAAGVLLFVRLNTVLYLGIILVLIFVTKIVMQLKEERKRCIFLWLKYAGVVLLSGGWYLIVNFGGFFHYYFSALFTSDSREAWQIHMDFFDNLLFYPKMLRDALMGKTQIYVIIFIFIVSIGILLFKKKCILKKRKSIILFVILSWFVPYGILTVMDNKNSAAAMVLISALIVCSVIFWGDIIDQNSIIKKVVIVVSTVIAFVGTINFSLNMMSKYPYRVESSAQGYIEANNIVATYMKKYNLNEAEIVFDKLLYNFFPNTVEVYSREKLNRRITVSYAIPNMKNDYLMSEFGEDEIRAGLNNSTFVVINQYKYSDDSNYKTDMILKQNREMIKQYAKENMQFIGEVFCDGNQLKIYAKPILKLETQWEDWLGENNTEIYIGNIRQEEKYLILEGESNPFLKDITIFAYNSGEKKLNTSIEYPSEEKYRLKIDISECDFQEDRIRLVFKEYFIPKEILESSDKRRLTLRYPIKMFLTN